MIGQCPRCQLRLELPASGAYQCQRCRQEFDLFLADPGSARDRPRSLAPSPPVSPATALEATAFAATAHGTCVAHPTNAATDACERSGDFMCPVRRTTIEGRHYCPRCFDLLYARGSPQFTRTAFPPPD